MTIARLLLGVIILAGTACSGTPVTPTPVPNPGPGPNPDPGPGVVNVRPTIGAFKVQGSREKQPPDFADLGETIAVSVTVTDPETPVANLTFIWSSAVGTFSGSGPSVTWRAPSSAAVLPADVSLNLEVIETYQSQGRTQENRVTGSTLLSLHNSVQEIGDLSRQFLLDFSNSSLSVDYVMRNFEPGCYGTEDETEDVAENRENFSILESNVGAAATAVGFGSYCVFRRRPGDACSRVPVYWKSQAKKDIYDTSGKLWLRKGQTTIATGVDQLAAMYYSKLKRWRLCDSAFDAGSTSIVEGIRGLVP